VYRHHREALPLVMTCATAWLQTAIARAGAAGSQTVGLAHGLLADTGTRVVYAQPHSELADTQAVLGLTGTEVGLLPHLPQGTGLWKIGPRSFVVEHRRSDAEIRDDRHGRPHERAGHRAARMSPPTRPGRDRTDPGARTEGGLPAPVLPWRELPPEPENLHAERAVLGAILLAPRVAAQALPLLHPEHFTQPWHRQLLLALHAVHASDRPLDAITAHAELRRRGVTRVHERDTGVLLAELLEATPTPGNGMHYAGIVLEYAARRRLVQAAVRLAQVAQDGHGDLEEVMRFVGREIACVRAAVDSCQRARDRDPPLVQPRGPDPLRPPTTRADPAAPAGNGLPRPPPTRDIDL